LVIDLVQRFFAECFAESNAPLKQLVIKIIHNKVPFSVCNAAQQHNNAAEAQIIAPNQ